MKKNKLLLAVIIGGCLLIAALSARPFLSRPSESVPKERPRAGQIDLRSGRTFFLEQSNNHGEWQIVIDYGNCTSGCQEAMRVLYEYLGKPTELPKQSEIIPLAREYACQAYVSIYDRMYETVYMDKIRPERKHKQWVSFSHRRVGILSYENDTYYYAHLYPLKGKQPQSLAWSGENALIAAAMLYQFAANEQQVRMQTYHECLQPVEDTRREAVRRFKNIDRPFAANLGYAD